LLIPVVLQLKLFVLLDEPTVVKTGELGTVLGETTSTSFDQEPTPALVMAAIRNVLDCPAE
jgi:hypothetical protein